MALHVNLTQSFHIREGEKITFICMLISPHLSVSYLGLDINREAENHYLWSIYLAVYSFLNILVTITESVSRMLCKNWVSFQVLRTFSV